MSRAEEFHTRAVIINVEIALDEAGYSYDEKRPESYGEAIKRLSADRIAAGRVLQDNDRLRKWADARFLKLDDAAEVLLTEALDLHGFNVSHGRTYGRWFRLGRSYKCYDGETITVRAYNSGPLSRGCEAFEDENGVWRYDRAGDRGRCTGGSPGAANPRNLVRPSACTKTSAHDETECNGVHSQMDVFRWTSDADPKAGVLDGDKPSLATGGRSPNEIVMLDLVTQLQDVTKKRDEALAERDEALAETACYQRKPEGLLPGWSIEGGYCSRRLDKPRQLRATFEGYYRAIDGHTRREGTAESPRKAMRAAEAAARDLGWLAADNTPIRQNGGDCNGDEPRCGHLHGRYGCVGDVCCYGAEYNSDLLDVPRHVPPDNDDVRK